MPATTYGCKILQLYEYEANEYRYKVNCEWYPKNATYKTEDEATTEWQHRSRLVIRQKRGLERRQLQNNSPLFVWQIQDNFMQSAQV